MEAWVRLSVTLLVLVTAVSVSTSPQGPPVKGQDPTDLTYNLGPDETSDIRLYEPGLETRQASERRPREAQRCTIVNNQRKCKPVRPGFGSATGRPGKETQDIQLGP